jgi:hypothetical protein
MKSIRLFSATLALITLLDAGCNETPSNTAERQQTPAQAQPFHGQIFKSAHRNITLNLISKEECELTENGTTFLCKYTKQNDTLRIVATALGTTQVLYYRITPEGVQDNDGNVLLAPEPYAIAQRLETAKQEEEQRQAQEQQRKELEQEKKIERISMLRRSTDYTQRYYYDSPLVPCADDMEGKGNIGKFTTSARSFTLTDSTITLNFFDGFNICPAPIYFHRIKRVGDLGTGTNAASFYIDAAPPEYADENVSYMWQYPGHSILHFAKEPDARNAHEKLVEVYNTWKAKYSDAVFQDTNAVR